MKKNHFQHLNGVLTNNEMKAIKGGAAGTCCWQGSGAWSGYNYCDQPKENVTHWSATYGGHWCCDSCGSATWLQ